MKNYVTFLLILFFSTSYSQDKVELTKKKKKEVIKEKKLDTIRENYFQTQLKSVITDDYRGKSQGTDKIIQPKLLNDRLTKAFNQVVFSSSDFVDNASAFGVTQNEEKATISVSTNFHLKGESENQAFIKAGINVNGSGSLINLYSKNKWQNSVGGNIGFIYKFGGSAFTRETDIKLKHNKALRKSFITDSIMADIVTLDSEKYIKLRKSYKGSIKKALVSEIPYNKKNDTLRRNKIKADLKKLTRIETLLKKIEKSIPYHEKNCGYNIKKSLDFSSYSDAKNRGNDTIIKYILKRFWEAKNKEDQKAMGNILKEVA